MAWVAAWGTAITINGLEQPVNLLIVRADCRNHYFRWYLRTEKISNLKRLLCLFIFLAIFYKGQELNQILAKVKYMSNERIFRGDMWPMNSLQPPPCPQVTQGEAAPQTPSAPQNPACEFGSVLLPLTHICHPFVLLWATFWCHVSWTHFFARCWDKRCFSSNHLPHKHSTHHTIHCWGFCLSTRNAKQISQIMQVCRIKYLRFYTVSGRLILHARISNKWGTCTPHICPGYDSKLQSWVQDCLWQPPPFFAIQVVCLCLSGEETRRPIEATAALIVWSKSTVSKKNGNYRTESIRYLKFFNWCPMKFD